MEPTVVVALIGSVPASLGAWAAVLSAKRSGVGNRDIRRVLSLMDAHMKDSTIHHMPERRFGTIRREGRA